MDRDKLMQMLNDGYCQLCDITAALVDMRSMVYGTPCNPAEYDAVMQERVKEMLFMTLDFVYILGDASNEIGGDNETTT